MLRSSLLLLAFATIASAAAAADYPAVVKSTPGLVGYWRFEEESGSSVTDSADKHYGRIELVQRVADGIAGKAVRCDGERSLVYLFRSPDLEPRTGDFTLEFWCRPDELGRNGKNYLIANKQSPFAHGNGGWYLWLQKNGTLSMRITETLERQLSAETKESVIDAGKWHHVAVVRAGNTVKLYADGKLAGEGAGPLGVDALPYADILLGGSTFGHHFPGLIDEAAYYNTALTAEAIAQHVQAGQVKP